MARTVLLAGCVHPTEPDSVVRVWAVNECSTPIFARAGLKTSDVQGVKIRDGSLIALRLFPHEFSGSGGKPFVAISPHLGHAVVRMDKDRDARTSGEQELARNRMFASWQGIATGKAAVHPGCASPRLRWH